MDNQGAPGYSGTPLAKKLGIRERTRIFLLGAPEGFAHLLAPLPEGVQFDKRPAPATDIAHIFVTRKEDLAELLSNVVDVG